MESIMFRIMNVKALHQFAKTTNRTEGEVVQAALAAYMK